MKKSFTIVLISFFNLIFANSYNMENFLPYKNEYTPIKDEIAFLKKNILHQNICQENNAIDVTDFADIKITAGVSDVVICFSSNNLGAVNESLASSIQNVDLNTYAPSGRVSGPYLIKGIVSYMNGHIASDLSMAVGVPADNCAAIGVISLPSITGNAYIMTTCVYPSGINPRQSYMSAYLEGVSSSSFGSIYSE